MKVLNKKAIFVVIVISVMSIFILSQMIFPVSCKLAGYDINLLDANQYDAYEDAYICNKINGKSNMQIITNEIVDFDDSKNFRLITFRFTANNNSIFKVDTAEFIVDKIDSKDKIFIAKCNSGTNDIIDKFKTKTFFCNVLVRSEGLSDAELQKACKSVHFIVKYKLAILGSQKQKVNLMQ